MTNTLAIPTPVSELNLVRGLMLTSTPPILVERRVSRSEAAESALRLATAAVGSGPRAVISTPPKTTDDDVTVLAFIKQNGEAAELIANRSTTVSLTAKCFNVPDAGFALEGSVTTPLDATAPIEAPTIGGVVMSSIELALSSLASLVRGPTTLAVEQADAFKAGSLAAAAASLANTASKPRSPLPAPLTVPSNDRDRLLLAASLLIQEVARLDRASVLAPA